MKKHKKSISDKVLSGVYKNKLNVPVIPLELIKIGFSFTFDKNNNVRQEFITNHPTLVTTAEKISKNLKLYTNKRKALNKEFKNDCKIWFDKELEIKSNIDFFTQVYDIAIYNSVTETYQDIAEALENLMPLIKECKKEFTILI